MPQVHSLKATDDLHHQLTERKHRDSEALEDVIRRSMGLEPRRQVLTNS